MMKNETTETLRQKANEAVVQALGDACDCGAIYKAEGYVTTPEEEFTLIREDLDRVSKITEAVLNAVGFDALLKERDGLHTERANLREAFKDAMKDIKYTLDEMLNEWEI